LCMHMDQKHAYPQVSGSILKIQRKVCSCDNNAYELQQDVTSLAYRMEGLCFKRV
jgi:hypothetical protein